MLVEQNLQLIAERLGVAPLDAMAWNELNEFTILEQSHGWTARGKLGQVGFSFIAAVLRLNDSWS